MLSDDWREADHTAFAAGNTADYACNLLFRHTWAAHLLSRGVHLVTDGTSALYLFYLARALHSSLVHNGLDEFQAGSFSLLRGMDAQHVHELNHGVVAVRRQEMDALTACFCLLDEVGKALHRQSLGHATFGCHIGHAVHRTEPNDILDVYIVAHKVLLVVIHIDNASQALAMQPEEIEERTVLTETVDIAGIVGRRVVIAHQQDDARADSLLQKPSTLDICLFVE